MEKTPASPTLVIDRPFGMVFVRAVMVLLAFWALAEGLMRAGVASGFIPQPRIGSVNAELDAKLILLDKYVQKHGYVDCIFLGSSQLDEAVEPPVFEQEFLSVTGKQLRCFNFSLGTMTASPAGKIAQLLVRKYQPRLLFVGISARDFSDDFGELARPLLNDPWLHYSLGEFKLSGWLTDNSLAYRELLTMRSALNYDYMVLHDRLSYQLTDEGFLVVTANDLSNPKRNFIPDFKFSKEDMAGLDEMVGLDSDSLQVIFVEVPVHASFIPFYIQADPSSYQSLFVEPILAYFDQAKQPFWQTQTVMQEIVPDSGWNDVKHFNQNGARIFSKWLAQRAALAVQHGEIGISGE